MQTFLLLWFSFCLLYVIGMTTTEVSGDIMKAVIIVAVCCLIGFVWVN